MANLFIKQAKQYLETRPSYPPELFRFIASNTPKHLLAWDVGTGSGQAARSLAEIYQNVIATDTSQTQLDHAPKLSNVRYWQNPPEISDAQLLASVAAESTVDVVTVGQALHWLHLPTFYRQARLVLRKPDGVVAAWCYTLPRVNPAFDAAFRRFYADVSAPFWDPARKIVDGEYRGVEFPFEAVEGVDGTGPVEFVSEREMDLGAFLTYVRSWSAYQTARERGVELLREEVVEELERAWMQDGVDRKIVRYPVFLRIGKVGNTPSTGLNQIH